MALTSIDIPSFFESPQNALLDAFKRRDLKAFKFALERLKADPNGIVDERLGVSVFKTILSEPNTSDFIALCIEHGADLYETNKDDLRPPLIHAVDSFSPENLKALLKNFDTSEVNAKFGDKNSLHLLAQCVKSENFTQLSECIKILLEHGVDVNSPDDTSRTPFFYLLRQQAKNPKVSELIDFICENFAVDLFSYRSEDMLRMFRAQNPHRSVPEKVEADLTYEFMRNLLTCENEAKFVKTFREFKVKNQKNAKFGENCSRLVYEAITIGSDEAVTVMKREGVDVGRHLLELVNTPLQLATSYGYHKIIKLLIDVCDVDSNLLHKILHASYQEVKKEENEKVDHQKCFEILLPQCDVNVRDDQGCTPLHYAARHRNHDAVVELIRRNAFIGTKNKFGETPLNDIKRETLEEALDKCIDLVQVPKEREQKEVKISVDLNLLVPSASASGESECLEEISSNPELRALIAHPVLATFIFLKWRRLSTVFYANFLTFAVLMWSFIDYIYMCHTMYSDERAASSWFAFVKILSLTGIVFLIAREAFQLVVSLFAGVNYFKSPVNIFELTFIALALASQLLESSLDADSLRVLRAFAILGAALEFLHLLGELPFLSISCNMVISTRVAATFLQFFLLYSSLLGAFALCFFVLFSNSSGDDEFSTFGSPGIALIKTLVMLTGEFDAASLSLHSKGVSYCLMFLLFLFTVTIVLFNLLSALAVDDTQKIKAQGELIDLCARIEVLRRYERMILGGLRWNWLERMVTVFPHAIGEGRVFVQPNKGFLLTTMCPVNDDETDDDEESEFGCIKSKLKMTKDSKCCVLCNRLDAKIGKKLRSVIEERKEKKAKEAAEKLVTDGMKDLKDEIKELKAMIGELKVK